MYVTCETPKQACNHRTGILILTPVVISDVNQRWGGHSDIGDLVANWPHLFKVKNVYLVGMFVLLHVLVFSRMVS